MKRRARPEQALAIAAAQYLRLALRPPAFFFAIDHGAGRMTPAAAGLLKARGGVRGLPDLMVMHPGLTGPVVCGLELKAGKGRVSPDQVAMAEEFSAVGASYVFCWNLVQVEDALRLAGIPIHARVAGNGSVWAQPLGATMTGRWVYSRNRHPEAPCALDEPGRDPVRVCRRCGYRRHLAGVLRPMRYQMCGDSDAVNSVIGLPVNQTVAGDDEKGRGD